MISEEDKQRVREVTDIVELVGETVVLRQRGGDDFWGCCPFHHEKSPSFHVRAQTGLWYCFGCHAGGDVFDYVMKREGLEFGDAVRYLAERAHIDIQDTRGPDRGPKRTRVIDVLEAAQAAYARRLMRGRSSGADEARHYFASRGFNADICRRWQLGFADGSVSLVRELQQQGFSRDEIVAADLASNRSGRLRDQFFNRVMFPIHDEQGRCVGFGGRVMGDGKPKYLNTRETSVFHKSKHLFAFDRAKESISAKGYAIVCEGYMDVVLPDNQDPDEFLKAHGPAAMEEQLKGARPLLDFVVDKKLEGLDLSSPGLRLKALDELAKILAPLKDSYLLGSYAQLVAGRLGTDVEATRAKIRSTPTPRLEDERPGASRGAVARPERGAGAAGSATASAYGRAEEPEGCVGVPDDYVPEPDSYPQEPPFVGGVDVSGGLGAGAAALTPVEQAQLEAERNLLTLLADLPDLFRPYADRIAGLTWADARHRAIAWAILATPPGTSPAAAVDAATKACPEAPRLLASGEFAVTSSWDANKNVEFVVNEVEIRSLDRRMAQITARVDTPSATDDPVGLMRELDELRRRREELRARQAAVGE